MSSRNIPADKVGLIFFFTHITHTPHPFVSLYFDLFDSSFVSFYLIRFERCVRWCDVSDDDGGVFQFNFWDFERQTHPHLDSDNLQLQNNKTKDETQLSFSSSSSFSTWTSKIPSYQQLLLLLVSTLYKI